MLIRDTKAGYGLMTRWTHWVMAVAILAMFALGLWMVALSYSSPYYYLAPDIHRSVGMLLLILLVLRFGWRLANPKPDDAELSPFERSGIRDRALGLLPAAVCADGERVSHLHRGRPLNRGVQLVQRAGARAPERGSRSR